MKVGLSKVIDTQKAMGWDNVAIPKVPATLLGSYSISPYDVTKLYQTIANQGGKIELSTIKALPIAKGILFTNTIRYRIKWCREKPLIKPCMRCNKP